ncbi:MAG: hypothetical protein OXF88_08340 [Rhodobacteraceae bacterium]|nr:hypothetical protein [Paracoccaceae bacterium]MCY4140010.1 hypothetical protein [Paracoccaceae bacterium]
MQGNTGHLVLIRSRELAALEHRQVTRNLVERVALRSGQMQVQGSL